MIGRALQQFSQRLPVLVILLAAGASSAQHVAATTWVGRPLGEALNGLRSVEFAVVFSSELVGSELRVETEPAAADREGTARALLQPFGLTLRAIAPGVYAVVLEPSANPSARQLSDLANENALLPLQEIIVSASQYRLWGPPFDRFRMAGAQLETQPKIANDPLRAVARLPGIANNGLSARISVRGGDVDEVRLLVDGFPIRQAFHHAGFQSLFSIFDAALFRKMDVYTGGFPARYGDRMSGVIDAETIDADDEPRRSLGLSSFHANARAAGILSTEHHTDGLFAARTGVVRSWLDQLGANNTEPNYSDAQAKWRWRIGDSSTVGTHVIWSQDQLRVSDPDRGETANISSQSRYAWLRTDNLLGERWRLSAWLGNTANTSRRSGSIASPGIAQGRVNDDRHSDLWDFKFALSADLSPHRYLEFGGDWQLGDGDYLYQSAVQFPANIATALQVPAVGPLRDLALSPFRRDFAFYGIARFKTGATLTSEIGLRAQRAAGLGQSSITVFDPRISINKSVAEHTQLRLSWGRFHQLDEVQEVHVEDGALGFADPQHSDHLIAGIEHLDRRQVLWRAEAFQKTQANPRQRFENYLNPLAILPELAPDRVRLRPSSAKIRGVEWSALRTGQPWSWHISYSWSQAFDELAGEDVPRSWDQTHALSASVDWQRGRWSVSTALNLHSGWPTTSLTNSVSGALLVGPRNAARWDWFRSLDLHVNYRHPVSRGDLILTLDVANALDTRNRCCADLVRGDIEQLTNVQRIPSLGLRWDF